MRFLDDLGRPGPVYWREITVFDPVSLLECEGEPPLGRTAAYSLGFFAFWLLCAGSCALSYYFLRPGAAPRGRG